MESEALTSPATLKCNSCKSVFSVAKLKTFLRHPICRNCQSDRLIESMDQSQRQEWYTESVQKLGGDEYTILTPYVNAHTKISFRHEACGNTFLIRADSFLANPKCPFCKKKQISSSDE